MTTLCLLPLPPTPCHREPLVGVAIHCEPVHEETNPSASLETRWIAASLAPFPPRNDNIKIGRLYVLIFYLRLMSWTKKAYCTYLLANRKNGTVYVGVSGNLSKRMLEHKNGTNEGFTKKYGLKKLVYLESFEVVENAIKREKQLKAGKRATKVQLIEKDNPNWDDLSADW